jgi:CBS-domain-containing membrane protein
MTKDVLTIGSDTPLKEAARRMLEAGISGLPVIDDDDHLIGIITEADFVATEADRRPRQRAGLLRYIHREAEIPSQERFVGDVMTTDVVVIGPDEDHADAARLMEKNKIKRIPVVESGRLIGLIARSDMLRAYTRPDQDIIDELTNRVMREVLWVDPRRVAVECIEGNIVLVGQMETKSDASLLVELTRRLDGVVSVKDKLTWEIDNTNLEMVSPPPLYPRGNW